MARRYRLGFAKKAVNVVTTALVRAGVAPPAYYLLHVRGRKTGREYTTPVRLVEDGGARWLVAPYGEREWVKNARAAGSVVLQRGRTRETFAVRELPDEERAPILQRYAREVPVTRPFFDARAGDDVSAFAAEAGRHPVFALTPQT
jgi:deazaflavin-dependent oxidoreductase (nitroreductase family)